ncbi:hypothetical protein GCM10027614_56010 [Micromonospora vulcania]
MGPATERPTHPARRLPARPGGRHRRGGRGARPVHHPRAPAGGDRRLRRADHGRPAGGAVRAARRCATAHQPVPDQSAAHQHLPARRWIHRRSDRPTGGRRAPSDVLAGWAQQVGAKVGIPPAAMQAYGYAELVLGQTNRSCALSWTTLAAIGQVESGHGSANGARLGLDGKVLPEIIGLRLDGNGGRMRIIDTDRGALDKDTEFDRAIGPMQFIPTTWQEIGADADNDGRKDPHDLDDAALAAGNYLCKNGRNLSIPGDWWNAILSYNDVRRYAQDVYDNANRYGQASRT